MNKILIATTIAMLSATSLAFAETTPISNADLSSLHCSRVEQQFSMDRGAYSSESAFQAAEQKAASFCRTDRHEKDQHDDEHGKRTGPTFLTN